MKLENYLFNPATQKWDLTKETLDLRHYNKGKGLKEDFKTILILLSIEQRMLARPLIITLQTILLTLTKWLKLIFIGKKQKKAPKSFKELIKDPFYCTIIQ